MFQAELPGCKVGRQIFGSFKSFQLKHKAGDLPNFIGIAFELQMQELLLVKFYFSAYSDEEFDMIRNIITQSFGISRKHLNITGITMTSGIFDAGFKPSQDLPWSFKLKLTDGSYDKNFHPAPLMHFQSLQNLGQTMKIIYKLGQGKYKLVIKHKAAEEVQNIQANQEILIKYPLEVGEFDVLATDLVGLLASSSKWPAYCAKLVDTFKIVVEEPWMEPNSSPKGLIRAYFPNDSLTQKEANCLSSSILMFVRKQEFIYFCRPAMEESECGVPDIWIIESTLPKGSVVDSKLSSSRPIQEDIEKSVSGHLEYIGLKDVNFTIRKKNEGYGAGVRLYVVLELPSSLIRKHYLAALTECILTNKRFKFSPLVREFSLRAIESEGPYEMTIKLAHPDIKKPQLEELRAAFKLFARILDLDLDPCIGIATLRNGEETPISKYLTGKITCPEPKEAPVLLCWMEKAVAREDAEPNKQAAHKQNNESDKEVTSMQVDTDLPEEKEPEMEIESETPPVINEEPYQQARRPKWLKMGELSYDECLREAPFDLLLDCDMDRQFMSDRKDMIKDYDDSQIMPIDRPFSYEVDICMIKKREAVLRLPRRVIRHSRIMKSRSNTSSPPPSKDDIPRLQYGWKFIHIGKDYTLTNINTDPIADIARFWQFCNHIERPDPGHSWAFWKADGMPLLESEENKGGYRLRMALPGRESYHQSNYKSWYMLLLWMVANEEGELISQIAGTIVKIVDFTKQLRIDVWFKSGIQDAHKTTFLEAMHDLSEHYSLNWNNEWKRC